MAWLVSCGVALLLWYSAFAYSVVTTMQLALLLCLLFFPGHLGDSTSVVLDVTLTEWVPENDQYSVSSIHPDKPALTRIDSHSTCDDEEIPVAPAMPLPCTTDDVEIVAILKPDDLHDPTFVAVGELVNKDLLPSVHAN